MFEKKKEFSWKIPTLVLLGVIVLSCGIGTVSYTHLDVYKRQL